jgi:hypothetical protein
MASLLTVDDRRQLELGRLPTGEALLVAIYASFSIALFDVYMISHCTTRFLV